MSESEELLIETFPVGALGCNCTLLADPVTKTAILVDPGDDPDDVLQRVEARGLTVTSIVHTHAHIDHVNGTRVCQEALGAPTELHEDDLFLYTNLEMQAQFMRDMGLPIEIAQPADPSRFLVGGDLVGQGRIEMEVLHTPGHTPGSLCFHLGGDRPVVFSGDTLFAGGIGRSDLWKGDGRALVDSIRRELFHLPDETLVIPGHGPSTTIGEERRFNPFVRS